MARYVDIECDAVVEMLPRCAFKTRQDIQDFLDNVPTADVVPVVHGHWIWHGEEFEYECSACHCRFDYNHTFEIFDHGFQYANWCPNCGARMDGEVQNNG